MEVSNDRERRRVPWTTRINIREADRDMIRLIAGIERLSMATVIGLAITDYVTARST